jgi:MoxR-like ATPase
VNRRADADQTQTEQAQTEQAQTEQAQTEQAQTEQAGQANGQPYRFASPELVGRSLRDAGYLANERICGVVYLGDRLGKPVLVEGPAGTGKTELAKSVARMSGMRLIRLQGYEGLDEAKALYEWNYKKQLLRIQAGRAGRAGRQTETADWTELESDIFSEEFLLARPLLAAIRAPDPVVLLIDEVDRLDVETEALLLEVLSDFQVSIPELGTITSTQTPLVFLTSNNSRELSEALKRRCLYLYIDYPSAEREQEIVLSHVPDLSGTLTSQISGVVRSLRQLELKKRPSVSETIDWARTLSLLGAREISTELVLSTLHILLKHQSDIEKAAAELTAGL